MHRWMTFDYSIDFAINLVVSRPTIDYATLQEEEKREEESDEELEEESEE